MADYDGSIRINTKIDTKDASSQLLSLYNQMQKTADKIASLRSKMDALKDAKIPTKEWTELKKNLMQATEEWEKLRQKASEPGKATGEYKALQGDLDKAKKALAALVEKQEDWKAMGLPTSGGAWNILNEDIAKASDKVDSLKEKMAALEEAGKAFIPKVNAEQLTEAEQKMQDIGNQMQHLVDTGKAFTLGQDTAEYSKLGQQLGYEESNLLRLNRRFEEMEEKQGGVVGSFERMKQAAQKALAAIASGFAKIGSLGKKAFSGIASMAKKAFSALTGGAKQSNNSFSSGLKMMLKYGLGIRSIYALINKFRAAVKEGFTNLAQASEPVNSSLSMLMSALVQLKNSLATAFAPILNVVAPALTSFINMLSQAATYVGMLTAALTGAASFTKAVAVQKDYAKSLNNTAGAAKKAAGALAAFDDINVLQIDKGGAGGGAAAASPKDMFEEVPVESKFKKMADTFKGIAADLFAPLKAAWDNQGAFVMDSWTYALEQVKLLAKSVGGDFLEVWNQPESIAMLEDVLVIVGDIGKMAGNLAGAFDEAWKKNDAGLRILESIRNIMADLIGHIRGMADATVAWTETLDFSPLLESVNTLLEALTPLADDIGAGLEWFWNEVLLPMAGWAITDAIPAFLDLLSGAVDILNGVLDVFKPLGDWLWKNFLKPIAEWTGGVIVDVLGKLADVLSGIGDWISEHSEAISKLIGIIAPIAGTIMLIVNAGALLAGVVGLLGAAFALLTSPITLVVLGIAALVAAFVYLYETNEEFRNFINGWLDSMQQQFENFKQFLSDIWEGIKLMLSGFVEFLAGVFTGDWDRAWKGIVKIFEGVGTVLKGIVNGILGSVETMANGVIQAINSMIRALNALKFDIPDWVPALGGKKFGLNLSEISEVKIPRLATGAVIRGGNPFIAMLGDQPRGQTNIEAPLSTIKQAVREELSGLNIGGNMSLDAAVNLNGEKVGELLLDNIFAAMNRRGYNVESLGWT